MNKYKLRFAPSPTGYMHLANARVAILNYTKSMQLKHKHGAQVQFILRIDDTDTVRSKQIYIDQIIMDLAWLEIKYDEIYYQSKRYDIYNSVVEKLKEYGVLYAAYETEEELKKLREEQLKDGQTPRYEERLDKTGVDKGAGTDAEKKPCWRFRIGKNAVKWHDEIMGEQKFESKGLYDPIVLRGNGTITYMLASIIDDYMMDVTHIMRGRDHLTNTAIQLHMLEALNNVFGTDKKIQFAHFSLLYSIEGKKLSKRAESANIKDFRAEGLLNVTLIRFLLNLGLAESLKYVRLKQLLLDVDMGSYNRADIRCDTDQLYTDNQKYLVEMNAAQAIEWAQSSANGDMKYLNIGNMQVLWPMISGEVQVVEDLYTWLDRVYGEVLLNKACVSIDEEQKEFLQEFMAKYRVLLEEKDTAWERILDVLRREYVNKDRSLKICIMAFRYALTGMEHGPKMQQLFEIMDIEKIKARLILA